MFRQVEIFDFIERPQGSDKENPRSSLERLFGKVVSPVEQCVNCLCERCTNNVEELWSKVRPEEQREPCFNCDECRYYTGENNHKSRRIEDCGKFEISDYAAVSQRKKFKVANRTDW